MSRVRGICGRLVAVAAVVLGMSFAIGQAGARAGTGTTVGGVLSSSTEWTTAGSPYIVTSSVQIPAGITLTIDPGVTVKGSGISSAPGNAGPSVFVLNGTLSAVGTAGNPISIDSGGANLIDPDGSGTNSQATFQHTVLTDGRAIVAASGYEQYASLNLLDSFVSGMTSFSYLWYNESDVIEGNVFYDSAGFSIGHAGTGTYVVDNNRFETASTSGYWVQSWNGLVDVNDNSFDAPGTPSVALECGYPGAAMDATSNDWGTTDTSVIASMIYDDNDNITCAGSIPYEPILDVPASGTPDGIFVNTATPAITGMARVGSTLTASTGTWGPTKGTTFAYQWSANGTPITGATSATYTPTPDVVGEKLTVTVTASKANYNNATATSASTAAVVPGNLTNTAAPAITGTAQVGSTLTAAHGTWDPADGLTFAYQWRANGAPISGATGSSFTIPAALAGEQITVAVTASATGYNEATATSAATAPVAVGELTNVTAPVITGTVRVGSHISVSPGTWSLSDGLKFTYQWLADGTAISGANNSTYTIPAALAGEQLTATVNASAPGYAGSATSAPTAAVAPGNLTNTAAPAITGTVKVGSKVSVTPGTWSPSAGLTFTYQWRANGTAISGATSSTYTIPASPAGEKLSVTVTAHKTGYDSAAGTSGAKTVAMGTFVVTAKPKLSGTPKVGKDLSVTKGTWAPAPTIKIQWYANGKAIAHATGATLKLTEALKGKTISVIVTASKTGYATATVTLKETQKVGAG